jgi:PAS domain S-box-containing protein
MENKPSSAGIWSNRHLWYVTLLMLVCSLFYYLDAIFGSAGWTPGEDALSRLHDFQGLIFFAPVVYAAYVFGLRGALLAALVSMIALYPYAIFVTSYADALYRTSAFGIILSAVGAAIAMLRRSDEQRRRIMSELRSLYDLGKAAEESTNIDEFLSSAAQIIPNVVQRPEMVAVRIAVRGRIFESPELREYPNQTTESLMVGDDELGSIEIYSNCKHSPVLNDCQTLVRTLAERISEAVRRLELEESLKVYSEQLEDMVERRTRDLNEAYDQLRLLSNTVKSSIDGITLANMEGNLTFANEAAERMWGYSLDELANMKLSRLYSPQEVDMVEKEIIPGSRIDVWTGELNALRKDGKQFPALVTTSPVYDEKGETVAIVGVHRDITETKGMRDKLIRSERLAAVGELASGVGHELRNPLNVIRNCVYLLNMTLAERADEETVGTLKLLDQQVDISNKIVTDLLNFTRVRPPSLAHVDLNTLVNESLTWVVIPEDVAVAADFTSACPAVLADAEQVGRAFGNIVSNAVQSMNGNGQLKVSTGVVNGHAWVTFEDTGCGIPEENLEKIFQPLFTTKPKGIGLGLAITRGLVEQNGGTIDIASAVGKGTAFTIKLPVNEQGGKPE